MSAFPEDIVAVIAWGAAESSLTAPYAASPFPWTTIPAGDHAPFATRAEAIEHAAALRAQPGMRWLALYEKFANTDERGNLRADIWLLTAVEAVQAAADLEEAAR